MGKEAIEALKGRFLDTPNWGYLLAEEVHIFTALTQKI